MSYETELKLHNGSGAVTLTTDGTNLLVNGSQYPRKFNNLVSGRAVVAAPARAGLNISAPNTVNAGRMPMIAYANMSGLRFHYASLANSDILPDNEVIIEAALELANGAIYPMTFQGSRFGTCERGGWLSSDASLAPDIPAGATYYVRSRILSPNNAANLAPLNGYTTLGADVTLGASSITLTDLPYLRPSPLRMRITGANTEVVEIIRMTTAASPYTATLRAALAANHTAAGNQVGQGFWTNREVYSDLPGGATATSASTTFDITTASFGGAAAASGATTIVAGASVGDTSIQVAAVSAMRGQSWLLDTAASAETIVPRTIVGVANPYTVYLTTPLTKAHSNGVALANTNSGGSVIMAVPVAITADYVSGQSTTVAVVGDSIVQGTGNYFRSWEGWATIALEPTHPVVPLSKSGESAQQFAADTNGQLRRRLMDLGDWLVFAYGTNDIYSGRTLAQTIADSTTILTWARTRGMKTAMATITPRTNSSDAWTTVAGQTITVAGFDTIRKQFNALVRSGFNGLCDVVIDVADTVETARDSGIWKADTTTGPYTVDGLHPSYSGHVLMSRACNASLFI